MGIWGKILGEKLDEEERTFRLKSRYGNWDLNLSMPQNMFTFNRNDAYDIFRYICNMNDLEFKQFGGRGYLTGKGYGDLEVYRAINPKDKSIVAGTELHRNEYFSDNFGIFMYSSRLSERERELIRRGGPICIQPSTKSVVQLDDKELRLFIASFYEVLNSRER